MRLGDISVAFVELMARAVSEQGHNPKPILLQYQLDEVRISSPQARISIPRFMHLGHAFIHEFNLPQLGLLMGQLSGGSTSGLAGMLAQCASNLGQACKDLTEFELLTSFNARGRSIFRMEQGRGVLEFYSISPYNSYNLFVVDSVLGGWAQFLAGLAPKHRLIERIEFEFEAPNYKDQYERHLPAPALFGCERNALVFYPDALKAPVHTRNASTWALLRGYAENELAKVKHGLSFKEQTERAIGSLLNGSTPSLDDVAKRLNSTPWVIRRRLQSEGYSFQQLLNDTRKDLAIAYVTRTSLTLGEIAYLLGFGSPVAFQRAFKRWTGIAPGQYRQSVTP